MARTPRAAHVRPAVRRGTADPWVGCGVARIPLVEPEGEPRAGLGGTHPNVLRAIANHPGAARAFGAFGGFVYGESSLSPAHRELAYLTATVANRCHY
jgi:alkylhydroperoxidase family enzyme